MATDLVGNEKLQRFIQLLSDLNHETAEAFSTGKTELLHKMNDTILEMYAIQQKGTEEAYTADGVTVPALDYVVTGGGR